MLRVGLTGGIACGKSFVAGLFRERGIPVVNDDDAARDAVAPGTSGLADVVAVFGPGVLLADGSLDRPKLGRIVFADDALRRQLMAVTFPYIGRILGERLAEAEGSGAAMVVYESALLIENGQSDAWRPLVVVTTTPELQLQRLCARNGLSEREARDRVASQRSLADKASVADHVICNDGTHEAVRRRFDQVFVALQQRAASGGDDRGAGSPPGAAGG